MTQSNSSFVENNRIIHGVVKDVEGRIDKILTELVELSRTQLKKLIENGRVNVEGKCIQDPAFVIRVAQQFSIHLEPFAEENLPIAENIPLNIVFEDEHVLVVDKPAGFTVHPGAGQSSGTLVNALMFHCKEQLSGVGGWTRPGIVHRLDKNTSGLLVVAKTDVAHHGLARQFEAHTIHRRYHAILKGVPKPESGCVSLPIGRDPSNRQQMAINRRNGKHAITHYTVLEKTQNAKTCLVECRLETGRTHQIRVHLTHLKTPILGDPEYGKGICLHPSVEGVTALLTGRQLLHAKELGFIHPTTKESMLFTSSYPEDFLQIVNFFRFSLHN